jgi:hypothetical protein
MKKKMLFDSIMKWKRYRTESNLDLPHITASMIKALSIKRYAFVPPSGGGS